MKLCQKIVVVACLIASTGEAFRVRSPKIFQMAQHQTRRDILATGLTFLALVGGHQSSAQASSAAYHVNAKIKREAGKRQQQLPPQELPSGASYEEYRVGVAPVGRNITKVDKGSLVKADVIVRTKDSYNDNISRAIAQFKVGSGQMHPSLEEGLLGMSVSGARRIHLPAKLVQEGKQRNQLPVLQHEMQRLGDVTQPLSFDVEILALR